MKHHDSPVRTPRRAAASLRDAGMLLLLVLAALTVRIDLPEAVGALPLTFAGASGEAELPGPPASPATAKPETLELSEPHITPAARVMRAIRTVAPVEVEAEATEPGRPSGLHLRTPAGTFGVEIDDEVFMLVVDVSETAETAPCVDRPDHACRS